MLSKKSSPKWVFLFQWTLINLLGTVMGVLLLVLMYSFLLSDASENVTAVFDRGISIAIFGSLLGFFQWLVLKSRIDQIRSWILATAIGLVIGASGFAVIKSLIFHDDPSLLSPTVVAAIIGALLGAAQWTVLRKHNRQSFLWILGSASGWSLGATAIVVAGISSFSATNVLQEFLLGSLIMILAIGIYSIITGCIFIWLLKPRAEHEPSTIPSKVAT